MKKILLIFLLSLFLFFGFTLKTFAYSYGENIYDDESWEFSDIDIVEKEGKATYYEPVISGAYRVDFYINDSTQYMVLENNIGFKSGVTLYFEDEENGITSEFISLYDLTNGNTLDWEDRIDTITIVFWKTSNGAVMNYGVGFSSNSSYKVFLPNSDFLKMTSIKAEFYFNEYYNPESTIKTVPPDFINNIYTYVIKSPVITNFYSFGESLGIRSYEFIPNTITPITIPENKIPSGYVFYGWESQTGDILTSEFFNGSTVFPDEYLIFEGNQVRMNLYAIYQSNTNPEIFMGGTNYQGELDPNIPSFITSFLTTFGFDDWQSYYIIYMIILITLFIILLKKQAKSFISIIAYVGLNLIFLFLSVFPLWIYIVNFSLSIILIIFQSNAREVI